MIARCCDRHTIKLPDAVRGTWDTALLVGYLPLHSKAKPYRRLYNAYRSICDCRDCPTIWYEPHGRCFRVRVDATTQRPRDSGFIRHIDSYVRSLQDGRFIDAAYKAAGKNRQSGYTQHYCDAWDFTLGPLEGGDAQALCDFLVEFVFNSEQWRNRVTLRTQKEQYNMVKFFKDGKALAVQTDASNEQKFTHDFALALQDYMTSPKFEGLHEVETYLNAYAELCCKMRGYKADVREQRLLTVGDVNPVSDKCVVSFENGQAESDLDNMSLRAVG